MVYLRETKRYVTMYFISVISMCIDRQMLVFLTGEINLFEGANSPLSPTSNRLLDRIGY